MPHAVIIDMVRAARVVGAVYRVLIRLWLEDLEGPMLPEGGGLSRYTLSISKHKLAAMASEKNVA